MLFDLKTDPREQVNLAAAPEHRETLLHFEALLAEHWNTAEIKATVLESQRRRMLVSYAQRFGRPPIWDYAVPSDPLARYMRPETGFWQDTEERARLPRVEHEGTAADGKRRSGNK